MLSHWRLISTPWKSPRPIDVATSWAIGKTSANEAAISRIASQSPFRGSHGLRMRSTTKPAAGNAGSTHASSMPNPEMFLLPATNYSRTLRGPGSPAQRVHFVDVRCAAVAEHAQHDGERKAHF